MDFSADHGGPIGTWNETADALWECAPVRMENLAQGAIRIVWGMFKKIVVADRLYMIVQMIFEHYQNYHGVMILVGAVSYTLQLYMEFSGCMDIVIGSGNLFGVALPENFRQPFFLEMLRNSGEDGTLLWAHGSKPMCFIRFLSPGS